MFKIRRNVFETNSSSSHSISIRANMDNQYSIDHNISDIYVSDDGVLYLWDNHLEFGRSPFDVLPDFYSKCKYAIASFSSDPIKREEVEKIMYEMIPGLKEIEYNFSLDYETGEKVPNYGYVDHQSIGVLEGFLKKHDLSIREFLLNPKYIVFIDGDEYCTKELLFDIGLLHKEDFEEINLPNEIY